MQRTVHEVRDQRLWFSLWTSSNMRSRRSPGDAIFGAEPAGFDSDTAEEVTKKGNIVDVKLSRASWMISTQILQEAQLINESNY